MFAYLLTKYYAFLKIILKLHVRHICISNDTHALIIINDREESTVEIIKIIRLIWCVRLVDMSL